MVPPDRSGVGRRRRTHNDCHQRMRIVDYEIDIDTRDLNSDERITSLRIAHRSLASNPYERESNEA